MLLILDLCFMGVWMIGLMLIFPGPDATDIKQAVKEISRKNSASTEVDNYSISEEKEEDYELLMSSAEEPYKDKLNTAEV